MMILAVIFTGCSNTTEDTNLPTGNIIEDNMNSNVQPISEVEQKEEIVENAPEEQVEKSNKLNSIEDVISKLSNDFILENESEVYYQMIMAYDGIEVDVNGINVKIYQYQDIDAQKSMVESLETADNIVFTVNNFLIYIHSTDEEFANKLKTSLK